MTEKKEEKIALQKDLMVLEGVYLCTKALATVESEIMALMEASTKPDAEVNPYLIAAYFAAQAVANSAAQPKETAYVTYLMILHTLMEQMVESQAPLKQGQFISFVPSARFVADLGEQIEAARLETMKPATKHTN